MKIPAIVACAALLAVAPVLAGDGLLITISQSSPSTQVLRQFDEQLQTTGLQALAGTVKALVPGAASGRFVAVAEASTGQPVLHFLEAQSSALVLTRSLTLIAGLPRLILPAPDGARLLIVTAQPSRLYFVDLAQAQLQSQEDLPWEVSDAAFTRDGEMLLLVSRTNVLLPLRLADGQRLTPSPIAGNFPEGSLSISVAPNGAVYISGPNALVRLSGVAPFAEEARTVLTNPAFTHPGKLFFMASGARAVAPGRRTGDSSIGLFDLANRPPEAPAGTFVALGIAVGAAQSGPVEPEPLDQVLVAAEDTVYGRAFRIPQPFVFRINEQGGITVQDIRVSGTPVRNTPAIATSGEFPASAYFYTAESEGKVYRIPVSAGTPAQTTLSERIDGLAYVVWPSARPATRLFVYSAASRLEQNKPLRVFVKAVDADGRPVRGLEIRLNSSGAEANVTASRPQTDSEGFAWFELTSPADSGTLSLRFSTSLGVINTLTLPVGSGSGGSGGGSGEDPAASSPKLVKVSGDGQLRPTGSVFDFLVVRAVDGQGNPLAGRTVRWQSSSPIGFIGDSTTTTNAQGEARITFYRTTPMPATAAFEQFAIIATSDVGSVTFYATEFPSDLPGYPNLFQEAPSTLDPTIQLKLGKPTSNLVVISVKSGIGDGRPSQLPIPNVGMTVRSENEDPAAGPVIRCAEGTALSSRDGRLTCSLLATGKIGRTFIRADVGGLVYYDRILAIVEPGDPVPPVIVSGNNQSGRIGTALRDRLVARIVDAGGNPLPGTTVTWVPPTSGGLTLLDTQSTADSKGEVSTRVQL
ncbi:MAG: Ig-like domain-containing protein, partial [Bryobacteraceae bacterium]|nr:Ig-like domain-containing protein [Bryobacteraceae bacterium]